MSFGELLFLAETVELILFSAILFPDDFERVFFLEPHLGLAVFKLYVLLELFLEVVVVDQVFQDSGLHFFQEILILLVLPELLLFQLLSGVGGILRGSLFFCEHALVVHRLLELVELGMIRGIKTGKSVLEALQIEGFAAGVDILGGLIRKILEY